MRYSKWANDGWWPKDGSVLVLDYIIVHLTRKGAVLGQSALEKHVPDCPLCYFTSS